MKQKVSTVRLLGGRGVVGEFQTTDVPLPGIGYDTRDPSGLLLLDEPHVGVSVPGPSLTCVRPQHLHTCLRTSLVGPG